MSSKPDLEKLLTLYGRKPVLEALRNPDLRLYKLHLADSNRPDSTIREIQALADSRKLDIQIHSRKQLSRISKNLKQDQGVALDISMPGFLGMESFLEHAPDNYKIIALEGVTNPQNLGMIIRSVCASNVTALLLPVSGCAKLDALVVKASAGTLFNCKIIRCKNLHEALSALQLSGANICVLDSHSAKSIYSHIENNRQVYVFGNESSGVNEQLKIMANESVAIPLNNGVESLNVAIAASLIAFKQLIAK